MSDTGDEDRNQVIFNGLGDLITIDADLIEAENHYRAMLAALGIEGDQNTPGRYVRALREMTGGADPNQHLRVQFPSPGTNCQLISVREVPFTSLCEHHMMPFWGHATIGYLPGKHGHVIGLSKLPRALAEIAHRPQLQERIGQGLVSALMNAGAAGAAVHLKATHACMALRGAQTGPGATMVTVTHGGALSSGAHRAQFDRIAVS